MQFNEDYYMSGKKKGLSNYENYQWLPELTLPMAECLANFLRLSKEDSVMDFGCARGYLAYALRLAGYKAYGYDISPWAIKNCHPQVKEYVFSEFPNRIYDFIVAKDVLEHIEYKEMETILRKLWAYTSNSMFFIVPLVNKDAGRKYYRKEDEMDKTHVIRWDFKEWMQNLEEITGANVLGSYHIDGLKPASSEVPGSTGFFLIRK